VRNQGGAYAFDGTTVGRDGAFVLDFSDLAVNAIGNTRWFVGMSDSTASDPTTLKAYQLYQVTPTGDVLVAAAANLPQSADAGTKYVSVDYAPNTLNQSPIAVASATPLSGNIPLSVNFSSAGSYDPDGQITAYTWNFGDGSSASGQTVSHTYTTAQTFTASLTVTDDKGVTASATLKITAADPNYIAAPSRLTVKAARLKVTLSWTDNSNNESGFYIERATLNGSVYSAYSVVGQTGANVHSYTATVTAGTYKYRVRAFNTSATSLFSNEVSIRAK
jgi:PKD repeat protein